MQGIKAQLNQFDFESIRCKNSIRFDIKSGDKHREKLVELCMADFRAGNQFLTRARLRDNAAVADYYSVPYNLVIEIQHSESDESIAEKKILWESRGFNFQEIKI